MAHRTFVSCWLLAAAAVAAVSGCSHGKPAGVVDESRIARVTTVKPEHKTLRRTVTRPAQIEPFDIAHLYAKIPAYVQRYRVDIGDAVRGPRLDADEKMIERGQIVADLSAPELDQDLEQKKALVAQAGADVEQAQAAIDVARADAASVRAQTAEATAAIGRVEAEHARWTSEYNRVVQLVSKSAVTQKLADETKSQMLAAEAARQEAEAKVESARAAQAASEAQVKQKIADEAAMRARRDVAEAEAARALAVVSYLTIEAPFDGTVSERHAEIGYFAEPGSAKPLFTVVRTDRVRVFIDLPEMDAPLANSGDRAVVRVQALGGRDFLGSITRTSWALDSATRTLRTEVDVPNPDGQLRPGMYAQVTIDLEERADACTLPTSALLGQGGDTWCYVVENGKALRKPITVGLTAGGEAEILTGLAGNEEVIVLAKGASLTEGQAVEAAQAAATK